MYVQYINKLPVILVQSLKIVQQMFLIHKSRVGKIVILKWNYFVYRKP